MTIRFCLYCDKPYQAPEARGNVTRYCSPFCRRMAGRSRDAGRKSNGIRRVVTDLTELNVATTLRWLACQEAGTHRPGRRETGLRFIGIEERRLPVCDTCEVPVTGKVTMYNLKSLGVVA